MQHMSGVVWHTLPKMPHGTIEGIPTWCSLGFLYSSQYHGPPIQPPVKCKTKK